MNQNKFNQMVEQLGVFIPEVKKWVRAPLFVLGLPEMGTAIKDLKAPELITNAGKICLPFETVRIMDTIPSTGGDARFNWIFHSTNIETFGVQFQSVEDKIGAACVSFPTQVLANRVALREEKIAGFHSMFLLGKIMKEIPGEEAYGKEKMCDIMYAILTHLLDFVDLVNCPRNFITRVSPAQPGRSVEWVERKSHYIVLSAEHNKQILRGGRADYSGTITRAMHNRRAHFRRLTAERFKAKRGLTVWVKASWVGPKEWQDRASGNQYKVLDRRPLNFHANTGTHSSTDAGMVSPGA